MVKHLRFVWFLTHRFLLFATLALMGLGFWLYGDERSLDFAKPIILNAVNSAEAPYVITIGDVTVNWRSITELGKLRVKNVNIAKRDGSIFAQMPEMYATIDPIGFLPTRTMLHSVIVRGPRMFAARNAQGLVELGVEGAPARMPIEEMMVFFGSSGEKSAGFNPAALPFHDFVIDDASLTFTDENSKTEINSSPFDLRLSRHGRGYDAVLSMPFTVDAVPVRITAGLRSIPNSPEHVLAVQLSQVPSKLFCLFDTCPKDVEADGPIDGTIAAAITDDFVLSYFRANISTPKALFTAPAWFAKPLKLGRSNIMLEGDWSKQHLKLTQAKLQLEDTLITASANADKREDGWYVTANAETTRLNIDKLYKYWPIALAPESRLWVTNKLKSGYAAKGTLKVNLTPADIAADVLPDASITSVVDAREITFEYLPNFPLVEKMNGMVHITGNTLKVDGSGGSLMSGTKVKSGTLWCPDLMSPTTPMETTLSLAVPASDAVTMLSLKQFPFDDKFGLNAKTIKGSADVDMTLKFDAFSNNPSTDPNEVNLGAVDYKIATALHDVGQDNVYGGYNISKINGTLKADAEGLTLDTSLVLGDSGMTDLKLSQPSGKPLELVVKGRESKDPKVASGRNDFTLLYKPAEVPDITVRGKRLDASVAYGGGGENALLANFPAMKLDIDLGELLMVKDAPFIGVKAALNCSEARCESADFSAKTVKGDVKGGITNVGGTRQFLLTAVDAGSLLKAFDITDRMTKGTFELRGTYDDKLTPPQLNARLLITDFNLQNSQILGRILSIASLTGVANALTGSGISFDKLSANMASRAGVITVDKGMANGAAIGITINGTVDTSTTKLDLNGVLVPAYALNSIVGKIPLIGALAGGEGEGLIGFNFSVKGNYAEPDVGVNPLSGLTPGFLRGIFSAFDDKKSGDTKASPRKISDTVKKR